MDKHNVTQPEIERLWEQAKEEWERIRSGRALTDEEEQELLRMIQERHQGIWAALPESVRDTLKQQEPAERLDP